MILGIGNDLCDARRIEAAIGRFGDRFLSRVFTENERAKADRRTGPARIGTYAKRFAAKEACAKALGTGFQGGVFLKDIGVVSLPTGQPALALTGGALRRLEALTPPGATVRLHLALTDDAHLAQAMVIIEAV